jgi:hypothetical protein
MTETKTASAVGAATPAAKAPDKGFDPEARREQTLEIEKAREEEAEKKQKMLDDARMGKVVSLEGARPEHEPPIGTKPVNPIPSGLVVGGPVLDLEEQARLARMKKGPEQAPGTKPV